MGLFSFTKKARSSRPSSTDESALNPSSDPEKAVPPSGLPGSASSHGADGGAGSESTASGSGETETDYKYHLMLLHVYRRAEALGWFSLTPPPNGAPAVAPTVNGVTIRVRSRQFQTFPAAPELIPFEVAVSELNCQIAVKSTSVGAQAVLDTLWEDATHVNIGSNTRIQVLNDIPDLANARRHQGAAFVRAERCLVIWSDAVEDMIEKGETVESQLMRYIWTGGASRKGSMTPSFTPPHAPSTALSSSQRLPESASLGQLVAQEQEKDLERGRSDALPALAPRPVVFYQPIISACVVLLVCLIWGVGVRNLLVEAFLDPAYGYARFALVAVLPFNTILACFFLQSAVTSVWQVLGPVSQCKHNSLYYSGIPPPRTLLDDELPHFTIQMPVYKEGLDGVIMSTIKSLQAAIATYEKQGGTANIIVSEDGMQVISEEEQARRREFYDIEGVAWVARPPHGKDGHVRAGRFKKASNLNYTNRVSLRIEELMDGLRHAAQEARPDRQALWTESDEAELYETARKQVEEEYEGSAWVSGDVRIGEFILLVDSDTRVPEDCFLDAANEFRESPGVAIIQHESDVMQVAHHYFENWIAHFTRIVNKQISFVAASGDTAPFVGHNAFLRWSAIQAVSFTDKDGVTRQWSENHVSEDFDLALRLQTKGFGLRWATYSNGKFKEGVSLTCEDELNRWQKYAYGCAELVFNPFYSWCWRSPFSPLFRRFIWSNMPISHKIGILSYIGTYLALACALPLGLVNFAILGVFPDLANSFYIPSWEIYLALLVVFACASNITQAVLAARLQQKSVFRGLFENFKYIIIMQVFFAGLSIHVSVAILAYFFCYNMTWEATGKEVERSNFFVEVPAILRRFWPTLLTCIILAAGMVISTTNLIPAAYRVYDWTVQAPLGTMVAAHFLFPFVLNPWLMTFHY